MSGWIKLHRSFEKWEWRDKPEMVSLFIHILLDANHESKKWHGHLIERGQVVFGLMAWSERTGISVQTLRTCIDRLKSTGELTSKSTNKFTILTVVNYDKYQIRDSESTGEPTCKLTNNQQTTNKQLTTPKEVKKERKEYIGQFSEFWELYPRRVSKGHAEKAYQKAIKEVEHETIITGVKRYAQKCKGKDEEYIAHASTWLNAKRWSDEFDEKQSIRKPFNPWKN